MHKVTIHLDRVFDVMVAESGGHRKTLFSFESNGQRHFGVSAYGEPNIQAGQTITALLKQPGNWKTLDAFVIHETKEVSCWDIPLKFGIFMLFLSGMLWYFLMSNSALGEQWIVLGVHAVLAIAITLRAERMKRIRQELLEYVLSAG
jgi:hypothetical protein